MQQDGRLYPRELLRKFDSDIHQYPVNEDRIYTEWNNSGDGSDTSGRKYETVATGPISKETVWGTDWATWVDKSY